MARHLIVDGYNVIHAHPELVRLADADMDLARARLIELMAEYARAEEVRVTVVFDGAHSHNPEVGAERVLDIDVLFSARGQSADTLIESLALSAAAPRDITVATSDRATQEAVFSRGVSRMSSRELVVRLAQGEEDPPQQRAKRRPTVADRLDRELMERLRRLGGREG